MGSFNLYEIYIGAVPQTKKKTNIKVDCQMRSLFVSYLYTHLFQLLNLRFLFSKIEKSRYPYQKRHKVIRFILLYFLT